MAVEFVEAPYHMGRYDIEVGSGPLRLAESGVAAELHFARTRIDVGESSTYQDVNAAIEREVRRVRASGSLALVLAGNCNSCLGTVAAIAAQGELGIVWFDAHGDFNTLETSISGLLEGMALAIVSDRHVPADRILLAGVRDLDPLEADRVAASGMKVIPSARLAAEDLPPGTLYVHIDIDVLNPAISPGVNFQGGGGLTPDELEAAVLAVFSTGRVAAVNIANYNPHRDLEDRTLNIVCNLIRRIGTYIPADRLHTAADSR